ncbi:MAG: acyltransferase [Clostridia bacterium]|nr:acyltransferase [Clostridia bacterium]NLS85511.1 acyltransferase [Oscillospiraceae bacterium]
MRKYYLDNIRWLTVALVLVYHVFYLFNAVGVLGGVGSFTPVQYQDAVLYFAYPWFMVLLFIVAGMSTRYALKTRTEKQFFKERTLKLLVPSTLGLLVFQWIVGWLNMTIGGGMEFIPAFMRYPIMALSGTGPLWFIQMLWLFSALLLIIRKLDKNDKLYYLGGKCNTAVLLLLFLPMWGASQILNAPVITTYRFGIYFLAFLLGYFVFSHDAVMDKIEKLHIPALIAAIVLGIAYVFYFFGENYAADACLKHIFTSVYLWVAVIAVLGCGKAWLNCTSPFASYMTRESFGIYIVHYVVALSVCYLLKNYTALPAAASYLIALAAVLLLSPALYEVIRRIPIIRFFVLGIKKEKRDCV